MRAVLVGLTLALTVTGCADPAKVISANSYRNAVALGAEEDLSRRGIALRARLRCDAPGASTTDRGGSLSVRCSGTTRSGAAVRVHGRASAVGTPCQREFYRVLVEGHAPLRTGCLGHGCR